MNLDSESNIAKDIFFRKIKDFNPKMTDEKASLLLGDLRNKLNNDDLGRELYNMISSKSGIKFIDYDNP